MVLNKLSFFAHKPYIALWTAVLVTAVVVAAVGYWTDDPSVFKAGIVLLIIDSVVGIVAFLTTYPMSKQ